MLLLNLIKKVYPIILHPKSHPSSKPNIRKIFQCYSILSLSLSLSLLPSYSFSHHSIHLRVVTFTVSSLFPKARPSINKETVNKLPTQRGLEGKKKKKKKNKNLQFFFYYYYYYYLLTEERKEKEAKKSFEKQKKNRHFLSSNNRCTFSTFLMPVLVRSRVLHAHLFHLEWYSNLDRKSFDDNISGYHESTTVFLFEFSFSMFSFVSLF
jgi:hypothetical protein